jgi:Cysteine-rich secretory protein family
MQTVNTSPGSPIKQKSRRTVRSFKTVVAVAGVAAGMATLSPTQAPAQAEPEWLTVVNAYRAASGVGPITNDPVLQAGVDKHVKYLAATASLVHDEDASHPLYTPEGALAAKQSLLGGWQGADRTDREIIEDWMVAPFHAVHLLEPRLQRGAFTSTRSPGGQLSVAGVVNIIGGIGKKVAVQEPILFPGRGSTIPMTSFRSEVPDPLTACPGYVAPAGLPILATFPTAPSASIATISQGGNVLEACVIDRGYVNPDAGAQATGRQLLTQKNLVMIIPKSPLVAGNSYDVSVDGGTAGKVSWTFKVGDATAGLPAPLANRVTQSGGAAAPAPAPVQAATVRKGATAKAPSAKASSAKTPAKKPVAKKKK